jgi:NAD(P)-dependent dehydrogenase (short-subunit alcohol dehydrogenase family)
MVETVHALTVRARTWQETTELVDKLNRALRGWANYFSVGCASKAFAEWSVYSATKAAGRPVVRPHLAADLKGRDIRINAVSPGVIDTPGYRLVGLDETQLAGFFRRTADTAPIGRNGVPSDVAKVVSFLASDDSRFITGSEIFVDGGIAQI